MHFLRVNVIFYDAVNMIHDVITRANPFPYSLRQDSCLSVLEIIILNKSDHERFIEYVHSVVVYQKYLTRFGEMIIFSPLLTYTDT